MKNQVATTNANLPSNLNAILSKYSQIDGMPDWDNISILGSNNIEQLVSRLRGNEKSLSTSIQKFYEEKQMFEGKTGEDFKKLASEFENPEGIKTHVPKDSWSGDKEPCDSNSVSRQHGASNYNICGWCKHASGSHRYNYCIGGSCSLLYYQPSKGTEIALKNSHEDRVKFDTQCQLHALTKEDCEAIVEAYDNEIKKAKTERECVRASIRRLQKEKKKATKKPYLIDLRPYNLYNVMDEIVVYTGGWEGCLIKEDWVTAKVIDGYRHHDGCVSYCTDVKVSTGEYLDGHGGGYGMSRPEGLLRWEYDFLTNISSKSDDNDLGFLNIWLGNLSSDLREFDKVSYMKALTSGTLAEKEDKTESNSKVPEINSVKDALSLLNLLMEPKTKKEVKYAVQRQIKMYHPDKHHGASDEMTTYAEEMTKAVYTARDILLARL